MKRLCEFCGIEFEVRRGAVLRNESLFDCPLGHTNVIEPSAAGLAPGCSACLGTEEILCQNCLERPVESWGRFNCRRCSPLETTKDLPPCEPPFCPVCSSGSGVTNVPRVCGLCEGRGFSECASCFDLNASVECASCQGSGKQACIGCNGRMHEDPRMVWWAALRSNEKYGRANRVFGDHRRLIVEISPEHRGAFCKFLELRLLATGFPGALLDALRTFNHELMNSRDEANPRLEPLPYR